MARQKLDPLQKKESHSGTFMEGALFMLAAFMDLNPQKQFDRPTEQMIQEGFEDYWVVASFEPGSNVKESLYKVFKAGYLHSRPGETIAEAAIIRAFQVFDSENEALLAAQKQEKDKKEKETPPPAGAKPPAK